MEVHQFRPSLPPPRLSVGVIGWLRSNLFSNWFNTLLTLLAIYLVWLICLPAAHSPACGSLLLAARKGQAPGRLADIWRAYALFCAIWNARGWSMPQVPAQYAHRSSRNPCRNR